MAAAIKAIIGDKVIGKGGKEIGVETFCGEGKIVGLYFSGHWCGPCCDFTPILVSFYEKIHKTKNLEIVFVSRDENDESFKEYFSSMPWLAMPFDDKYKDRDSPLNKFKVEIIPTLIIIDGADGKVMREDGREQVENDMNGENFPWIGGAATREIAPAEEKCKCCQCTVL